jgi:hypothetical protein
MSNKQTQRRCDVCDFIYDDCVLEEIEAHERIHDLFLSRCKELRYTPKGVIQREALYYKGIRLIKRFDLASQHQGALFLIQQHFNASLHAAVLAGFHKEHPDFESYIAMVFDSFRQIPDEVKKRLLEEYGTKRSEIAPGFVQWYPKGSAERIAQFQEYNDFDSKIHKTRKRVLLHESLERSRRKHN